MADQVYWATTGDWYLCLTATSPGESPASAPAKWERQIIPMLLRDTVVAKATALLLYEDGQHDKALVAERRAEARLDELVFRHGDNPTWHDQPTVRTR